MKINVVMPQLGESITEGEVIAWLKSAGDSVERDEGICEVKTDKATVEIPAPASGVLSETLAEIGATLEVGANIAVIDTSSEEATTAVETSMPAAREVRTAPVVPPPRAEPAKAPSVPVAPLAPATRSTAPAPEGGAVRMTPVARRLVRELNLDPAALQGSGAGGRITRSDVLKTLQQPAREETAPLPPADDAAVAAVTPDAEAVPLSPMRRRIAARLVHSKQTIPHVTTVVEVDMTDVNALRKKHKEAFAQDGLKLTFMPFIMKATVGALKEFKTVNASWGGDKLIVHKHVHLGIAVSVEGGLAVPVIHDADAISLRELTQRLGEVAEHARAGKLTADEVQGGTFTITNPGMFGTKISTPIINPPEAAILAVCRIAETPVVREGEIVIRLITNLCLSYDHRIVDGETAIRFLQHIRAALEAAEFDLG